jgi:uncharacterized protein YggE
MRCPRLPLLVLLLAPLPVFAQQKEEVRAPATIRTAAESTVTVRPDQVQVDAGVITQGATAEAATAQNAQLQDTVIKKLRAELGKSADIRTISYAVTPVYRYPKDGAPTVSGYSASNVIEVTVDDPAKAGRVIDLALQAGANQIQRLRFSLKDEQAVHLTALREAGLKARAKAEALAAALGLQVVRIRQLDEGEELPRPVQERAFALAEAAPRAVPSPVEAGTLEVSARVTLIVEVAPR